MRRRNLFILMPAAFILMFITAACSPGGIFAPKPYKETQFLMDTIIEITAYGSGSEAAVEAAFGEFKRIQGLADHFDPNSQVSKINAMAGKAPVQVDPELISLLKLAQSRSEKLDGALDVTVGPLTQLWGIGHKGEFVPTQAEIDKMLPLVNYRLLQIDETNNTVFLPQEGMSIDLGAVAKGFANRKAVEVMKARGIKSALLNAGGDVRVIGTKPDGQPWRIGVQHPRNSDGVIAKISMTGWDVLETSGDYQRYFIKDGVRYSHILDARTGRQPGELASVTMVTNSADENHILSTAIFILGAERGQQLLRHYFPEAEAILVTVDGRVILTPGLEGKVEVTQ
ncbi:MAG TPA: FAD:protein FMN transferase [Methylomusa anaerophila]|uniref:FAD:protein FMN transferase n=1 Tax=Methylomusa anaerophila TaxID=1930071 RepID=A0A348AGU5_9FIRM|nr:FAD:protein FMN transferase [Methylomusa anaerophila]BBB90293.1 thiamine biosynthesis lipoprotein ApbE precursor [Methylomusa anaerophila]HML89362.1 FAD:protein FMN transferase [Methylomusa anaerophila]